MSKMVIHLGAAAALGTLVSVSMTGSAFAQSCTARCNELFNPADYPKDQRWNIQRQLDQCLRTCRTRGF
jgi:hypothetical protein